MSGAQLYPGLAPGSEPFWPNRDLAQSVSDSNRALQMARVRRSELGLEDVRFSDPAGYQAFRKA